MSALPTRILRLVVRASNGQAVPLATVTAQLVDAKGVVPTFDVVADGAVVPSLLVGATDEAGSVDLALWPNARGIRATKYRILAALDKVLLFNALVYIPDGADVVLTLADVVIDGPLPPLSQLEAGLLQVTQAQLQVAANTAQSTADRLAIEDIAESLGVGVGGGSSTSFTLPAAIDIAGHRVVRASAGRVVYASSDDLANAASALGISSNTAAAGGAVTVKTAGRLTEPSWNWTPDRALWLGVNGTLSQTYPASGVAISLGVALSATEIFINPGIPLIL